jgi:hypothetical protein
MLLPRERATRGPHDESAFVSRLLFLLPTVIAAFVLASLSPARAAGAVITFDDLPVPTGGRVTVNNQYSGQGVTFNDASAIDYSQAPFPPGFAHSGTVAVEQCFAIEFCTTPVIASFTTAQLSVRVWVGASYALAQPLGVRLTAFNAAHVSVGTANVTLPANSAVTRVETPLAVTVGNPTIRSLEVSIPGGYTSGLVVDDVEFSSAGPPPPCNATSVPTVQLTEPSGSLVQNNEFLLQGSVATGGAPIQSASIIEVASSGHSAPLYPSLIQAMGGAFGPVRFNGLLSPGGNKIIVTATNCLGTGVRGPLDITWNPIPAAARFRLLGLEVTQGVQSLTNPLPLIASTANGVKRTFARVYLGVAGVPRISSVSGMLTATRADGSLPGGPASIPSLNSITVDASGTLVSARSSLAAGLNFELPREWLAAGSLHLQLEHLEIEGTRSQLACDYCDNPAAGPVIGSPAPPLVQFHTVPPLRIWLVGVPSRRAGTDIAPRQLDFDMLVSWLRRVYPSADVQITQANMGVLASPPTSCDDVNAALSDFVATLPTQDARTRYYGLIPHVVGTFIVGCSAGQFGSGPAGPMYPEANHWDTDGSYADWYGGHELAHAYGRAHPGFCAGQTREDANFPYQLGSIGNADLGAQGFDAGDAALGLPLSVNGWLRWHDVMTYCAFQWMSDYTYRGILQKLCAEDHANCPDFTQLSAFRTTPAAPHASRTLALYISGTLMLANDRLRLRPLWTRRGLTLTARPRTSEYAIELRGSSGRLLARYPFEPKAESDAPSPRAAKALVREVVTFRAGTRRIVFKHAQQTVASVPVSAHSPTVHVISPNRGKALQTRVTVRWTSRDRDGGRRWYSLLYSPDGRRLVPVASALTRRSLTVDLTRLPGGSRARFEVIATDGVRTGSDRSDRPFTVPVKVPRVAIAAPATGAELVAGQPAAFSGTVSDLQDGFVPPQRLLWRSSVQGPLGQGLSISPVLRPGTHAITLQATNTAGATGVAQITVTVRAVPPVMVAAIGPAAATQALAAPWVPVSLGMPRGRALPGLAHSGSR